MANSSSQTTVTLDPKEAYNVVTSSLPNIVNYLKVILKREKLSEEAEAKRQKYEIILSSLEHGVLSGARPLSIVCDDDNGYFSAARNRGLDDSELQKIPHPFTNVISDYLLWQDEKGRWRRCWCKAENRDLRFYIYEDNNADVLLRSFSLENIQANFEDQVINSGKDNSFLLSGVLFDAIGGSGTNRMEATTTPIDIYFAAYTESEGKKWKDILHQLISSSESAGSFTLDSSSWLTPVLPHDSASSSSSNFSSNRDSMVSNTSSLYRAIPRSELGDGKEHFLLEGGRTLSVSKQQQPLPSPPHQPLIPSDEESTSAPVVGDEDNVSVGTIYESIDNLVLQFDDAIRNMGEDIKASTSIPAKSMKKKERSIFRQHSFLSSHTRSSKSNLWSEKRSEFEKGERYSGFMLKKNDSGSWKKKWCVLKGCVFGYYKSQTDNQGREFVILHGIVQPDIEDEKKNFVFSLNCTGVQEMCFSVGDAETYSNWVSKLQTACAAVAEYSHALQVSVDESAAGKASPQVGDSLYNVPRALFSADPQLYDTPRGNPAVSMTPDAAIDSGIYNVPRALFMEPLDDARIAEDTQYLLGSNPLDIYDYPRVSISPDEEGIYDDPLDIIDMEIYDYPPDASELGIEEFPSESSRSSTVTISSEQYWRSPVVPPIPRGARPSVNLQHRASFEEGQNPRDSTASLDEKFRPYSNASLYLPSAGDGPGESVADFPPAEAVDASTLEYGQCSLRGYLYKKERFMTWVKLFCVIRNNFLECRKSHGDTCSPSLKLFLPGSEVKQGGGDAKKKWAFQIRHPRREGVLVFASDCEADLRRWMKAFQSGTSIQVQPVNTVEEIRITDLEMQKRWTTLDRSNPSQSAEEPSDSMPPRRKTFSAGTVPEEFSSDTLKRRSKFSWVKSNFMRRKGEKKILSGSQTDLNAPANRSSSNVTGQSGIATLRAPDPLRKSVSLELLPTTTDSDESSQNLILEGGSDDNFRGYLRVQRKGADNVWVRYWCVLENFTIACYISQRDLTLALSIQLQGSRVAEAELECQRRHSFKVLHVESGQCLYFAADSHEDFFRWFSETTKYGHQVVSDESDTTFGPFVHFYFIPKEAGGVPFKRLSVVSEGGSSNFSEGSTTKLSTASSVFYRGELLKASHTGKWKQRYCVVSGGSLGIFHSSTEGSPIISILLRGVSLELISTSPASKHEYQFKLNPSVDGKSHTFAAPSETEMYAWVSALRDASCAPLAGDKNSGASNTSSPTLSRSGKSKRKSKKLKDADLISYIPASSISNPDRSGFLNLQFGSDPWTRFWCIASGNCLYVYQSKAAVSTVKTVVLPGYEIKSEELHDANIPYNFTLFHEGISPVCVSVQNQDELGHWVTVLESYTRAEGSNRHTRSSAKSMADNSLAHKLVSKTSNGGKKGPVKADHTISAVKAEDEPSLGDVSSTKRIELFHNYQDLIIRRYEKRIRKTRRVANQTDQKLKKQQASLLHFKKELSRHVVKLQELSNSGDPHAIKRLKSVRTKLLQLDKIVPYLGKYISVNRQAEMQTVAVLKESCTVELQKLSQNMNTSGPTRVSESKVLPDHIDGALPSPAPELPSCATDELQDKKNDDENPYASLTEVKQEQNIASVKLRSNYAELDFQKIQSNDNLRPPSVKYSEVRIGKLASDVDVMQSDSDLLPMTDVVCLDSTLTQENASSTEQDTIEIHSDDPHCSSASDLTSSLEDRLTSSDQNEHMLSEPEPPTPEVKHPPAVSKKPAARSPLRISQHIDSNHNTDTQIVSTSSDCEEVSSQQGIPSIKDRIKALQQ